MDELDHNAMTITFIQKGPVVAPAAKTATAHAKKFKVVVNKTNLVLNALLAGQRLTVRDAAVWWDLYCLGGLVYHLRHHRDVPVKTLIIKKMQADGLATKYAEYFLTALDIAEVKAKKTPQ
ncbi:MAG: hypothetical protein SGJ20_21710 [Planctomycetota bacterium]|nr:hypothetical protein [Planctomycetota bacterium]